MTEFEIMLMNELIKAAAAQELEELEERVHYVSRPAWLDKRIQQIADLKGARPGHYECFFPWWSEFRLDQEWQRVCGPHAAEIQARELAIGEEALVALLSQMADIAEES